MNAAVLSPGLLGSRLHAFASAYQRVFGAQPWGEDHTEAAATNHIRLLVQQHNADVVVAEDDDGSGAPIFEMGVVLHSGNRILGGLSAFGARDGHYYLSEFVVPADRDDDGCDQLVRRLVDIATVRGSKRVWVRTHPQAERDHRLFQRHGFKHHGTYSHKGRTFVVLSRELP